MNTIQAYLSIVILFKINSKHVISSEEFPSPNGALLEILTSCKNNYDTVLISVDARDINLSWIQHLLSRYTTIIHGDNFNLSTHDTRQVDAVVLKGQSIEHLINMIHNLSVMKQWDLTVPIFMLDESIHDCSAAAVILKKTWHYEFLNSYYLCFDQRRNDIYVYTYNPFTSRESNLWTPVDQKRNNQHRWTMFYRKYTEGNICQDFHFDRMKFLDGYKITIACWPHKNASSTMGNFYNHSTYYQNVDLCSDLRNTVDALVTGLNVTLTIYSQSYNWANHTESLKILKSEIYKNSSADLIMIRERLTLADSPANLSKTDIIDWSELGIVTYNKGYKTFLEKILGFYGFSILSLTLLIMLITFSVILTTSRRGFSFAIFEIIRLIIGHTFHSEIRTPSMRIFFCVIFIYFMILQALFNSHLAKFLTNPEQRKQADSLIDLHDLGHTSIYNTTSMKSLLAPSTQGMPTTGMLIGACLTHVIKKDTSAACISRYSTLYRMVRRLDLVYSKRRVYIGRKTFGAHYAHFTIRRRHPFKRKVNRVFAIIIESGIRKFWSQNLLRFYTYKEKQAEALLKQTVRPIEIEDVAMIFIILGTGLSCAAVTFVVEKWFSQYMREINIGR